MKKFKIDGSLTTTGNVVVQGNLEIKGITTTVNQETLTIKDNFIAVNGSGDTIDAVGMAGIVAVTGGEHYTLKSGNYWLNINKISEKLPAEVLTTEELKTIAIDEKYSQALTNLKLKYSHSDGILYPGVIKCYGYGLGIECQVSPENDFCPVEALIGYGTADDPTVHPGYDYFYYKQVWDHQYPLVMDDQIVSEEDAAVLTEILLDENKNPIDSTYFTVQVSAYAAPIYDKNDDTLKIGLGSFTKDDNGNITGFEFGAGQDQSIATRANNIENNRLLQWNSRQYRLEQSPITTFGKSIKVDGNIGAKGNFVIVNTDAESLDEVNAAGTLSVTGKEVAVLKDGVYKFNYDKIVELLDIHWEPYEDDSYYIVGSYNTAFENKFENLFYASDITREGGSWEGFGFVDIKFNFNLVGFVAELVYSVSGEDQYPPMLNISYNKDTGLDPGVSDRLIKFSNQMIEISDIDFVCSLLFKEDGSEVTAQDFQIKGEAYASPIYDPASGTVKIGQGTYERDFNGNVTKFEFGSGQEQSVATRADNINNNHLVVWNNDTHRLEDSKIDLVDDGNSNKTMRLVNYDRTNIIDLDTAKASLTLAERAYEVFTSYYWDKIIRTDFAAGTSHTIAFPQASGTFATREWVQAQIVTSGGLAYATEDEIKSIIWG